MRTFGKIILIIGFLGLVLWMLVAISNNSNIPLEPTAKQIDACVTLMWVQSDLRLSVQLGLIDKRILASQDIIDRCESWGIMLDE